MILLHPVQTVALDAILNAPDFAGATVCATVTDSSGTIIFDRNGSTRVSPASNEKLFSAAFALYELGPDFHPATKIWREKDRVVVSSQGDPTMTHDDLVKAATSIGLDRTLPVWVFAAYDPEIPEGWEYGDLPNRYAAPVGSFSVEQSGFELWNHEGKLELRPESYGVRIKFGKKKGKPEFHYDPIKRLVFGSGVFPKKTERLDTLAVPNASLAASLLLGKSCCAAEVEPNDPPAYTITGKPLSEVLPRCLQHSDNNMAENLLLMGAAHLHPLNCNHPYPEALTALRDFESRVVGLDPLDLRPQDGSGLTRSNAVTTHAVTKLLNWSQSQPTATLWTASLATPGGVGTLVNRLKGITFHGKTGSLSHVTALSGYLVDSHSRNLTVSIIVNNFNCTETRAHELVDKFIRFFAQNVA